MTTLDAMTAGTITIVSGLDIYYNSNYFRRVARIFRGGGGVRLGSENANSSMGSGGMLPRENFRKFGVPWTAFYAF